MTSIDFYLLHHSLYFEGALLCFCPHCLLFKNVFGVNAQAYASYASNRVCQCL